MLDLLSFFVFHRDQDEMAMSFGAVSFRTPTRVIAHPQTENTAIDANPHNSGVAIARGEVRDRQRRRLLLQVRELMRVYQDGHQVHAAHRHRPVAFRNGHDLSP